MNEQESKQESKLDKLTSENHRRFVVLYAQYLNGRKAYQEVYTDVDANTAAANASRLLTDARIKEAVDEECKKHIMPKGEILGRINSIAQINIQDYTNDSGEIDIKALKEAGLGYMIREISDTKFGKRISLHDQSKALDTLAKIAGLYNDRSEVTVNINNEIKAEEILNDRLQQISSRLQQPKSD